MGASFLFDIQGSYYGQNYYGFVAQYCYPRILYSQKNLTLRMKNARLLYDPPGTLNRTYSFQLGQLLPVCFLSFCLFLFSRTWIPNENVAVLVQQLCRSLVFPLLGPNTSCPIMRESKPKSKLILLYFTSKYKIFIKTNYTIE